MDAGVRVDETEPGTTVEIVPRNGSNWTGPRLEMCKKLYDDGFTASQIAAELGGVTRNAVIGIIHRKGWGGQKGSPGSPTARIITVRKRREGKGDTGGGAANAVNAKVRRLKVRGHHGAFGIDLDTGATSVPLPEINPAADFEIGPAQRRTLLELTNKTCRWPVGDPQSPEFFFCGATSGGVDCEAGHPYCALHARRAYDSSVNAASSMRWAAARATYQSPRHL